MCHSCTQPYPEDVRISKGETAEFNPSESLGVPRSPSESLGVLRSPSESFGVPRSPSESLGVLRSPSESFGVPRSPSESLGVLRSLWSPGILNSLESHGVPRSPLGSRNPSTESAYSFVNLFFFQRSVANSMFLLRKILSIASN